MRPDFAGCGSEFLNKSTTLYSTLVYHGPVHNAYANAVGPTLITVQGCKDLCGTGVDYYSWKDASNTITTWVLPIIGLLLQAPYESNKNWSTVLLLSRWVGNPIASLSYLLWNIKVTGKCALMCDMATKYHEFPDQGSEFSVMRDSLFVLSVMNQYSTKSELPPVESERLLRLVLFSNLLPLSDATGGSDELLKTRTRLAQDLREGRKKGVIPVFVSFLWFVFALALSVQLAFGSIGDNQTAHNLAIGFLTGWLPIMVIASTVDRNVVSADSIQERLNRLVDDVRLALLNPEIRAGYMRATRTGPEDFSWCDKLADQRIFDGDFFTEFAGQGRKHWHYGVAHPLLAGIEAKFMARYGRDWLCEGYAARLAMVVGSRNVNGLKMFDPRMVWQVTNSLILVVGSAGGSFIISYYTPTVGLGCRSGGYAVYIIIALGLLMIEVVVWWLTHERTPSLNGQYPQTQTKAEEGRDPSSNKGMQRSPRAWSRFQFLWKRMDTRDVIRIFVIRPGEIFNSGWLVYIIAAQTFGSYQTCERLASTWARSGGYIDFATYNSYQDRGVYYYWGAATALSITVMSAGLAYIVVSIHQYESSRRKAFQTSADGHYQHEYCTQSHLSTEHYDRAMRGLKQTRRFKRHFSFVRSIPNYAIRAGKYMTNRITGGKTRPGRRSLVWSKSTEGHVGFFDE